MDYLVVKKTGEDRLDLTVVGLVEGLDEGEGQKAIEQSLTEGEGLYTAIPFESSDSVQFQACTVLVLEEPVSAEASPPEPPEESDEEPAEPEDQPT